MQMIMRLPLEFGLKSKSQLESYLLSKHENYVTRVRVFLVADIGKKWKKEFFFHFVLNK